MKHKVFLVVNTNTKETVAVYNEEKVAKTLLKQLEDKLSAKLSIKEMIVDPHIDFVK